MIFDDSIFLFGGGVALLMAAGFGFIVYVAMGCTVNLLRKFDEQRGGNSGR